METQYTVRHFLDTVVNTNLLLKENINKMERDILSFDEFMTENYPSKKNTVLLNRHTPETSISQVRFD